MDETDEEVDVGKREGERPPPLVSAAPFVHFRAEENEIPHLRSRATRSSTRERKRGRTELPGIEWQNCRSRPTKKIPAKYRRERGGEREHERADRSLELSGMERRPLKTQFGAANFRNASRAKCCHCRRARYQRVSCRIASHRAGERERASEGERDEGRRGRIVVEAPNKSSKIATGRTWRYRTRGGGEGGGWRLNSPRSETPKRVPRVLDADFSIPMVKYLAAMHARGFERLIADARDSINSTRAVRRRRRRPPPSPPLLHPLLLLRWSSSWLCVVVAFLPDILVSTTSRPRRPRDTTSPSAGHVSSRARYLSIVVGMPGAI